MNVWKFSPFVKKNVWRFSTLTENVEISLRLKEFVDNKFGGNVAEFARQMGMKRRQDAYPYINGTSIFGGEKLSLLSKLGCDINWLLNGDDNQINGVREKTENYNNMTFTDLHQKNEELTKELNELKIENYDLLKGEKAKAARCGELEKTLEALKEELKKLNEELKKYRGG